MATVLSVTKAARKGTSLRFAWGDAGPASRILRAGPGAFGVA
jgi:hypothetical protein